MPAGTRLPADQFAALASGGAVTVKSDIEIGRPRHVPGAALRIDGPEWWSRLRALGVAPTWSDTAGATLTESAVALAQPWSAWRTPIPRDDAHRRQLQRIDRLFRAWYRNRGDVEVLRELHAAIGERLGGS